MLLFLPSSNLARYYTTEWAPWIISSRKYSPGLDFFKLTYGKSIQRKRKSSSWRILSSPYLSWRRWSREEIKNLSTSICQLWNDHHHRLCLCQVRDDVGARMFIHAQGGKLMNIRSWMIERIVWCRNGWLHYVMMAFGSVGCQDSWIQERKGCNRKILCLYQSKH